MRAREGTHFSTSPTLTPSSDECTRSSLESVIGGEAGRGARTAVVNLLRRRRRGLPGACDRIVPLAVSAAAKFDFAALTPVSTPRNRFITKERGAVRCFGWRRNVAPRTPHHVQQPPPIQSVGPPSTHPTPDGVSPAVPRGATPHPFSNGYRPRARTRPAIRSRGQRTVESRSDAERPRNGSSRADVFIILGR